MAVWICDRCGDVGSEPDVCRCRTPYDPVAVRRRFRQAVTRARETDRLAGTGPQPSRAA